MNRFGTAIAFVSATCALSSCVIDFSGPCERTRSCVGDPSSIFTGGPRTEPTSPVGGTGMMSAAQLLESPSSDAINTHISECVAGATCLDGVPADGWGYMMLQQNPYLKPAFVDCAGYKKRNFVSHATHSTKCSDCTCENVPFDSLCKASDLPKIGCWNNTGNNAPPCSGTSQDVDLSNSTCAVAGNGGVTGCAVSNAGKAAASSVTTAAAHPSDPAWLYHIEACEMPREEFATCGTNRACIKSSIPKLPKICIYKQELVECPAGDWSLIHIFEHWQDKRYCNNCIHQHNVDCNQIKYQLASGPGCGDSIGTISGSESPNVCQPVSDVSVDAWIEIGEKPDPTCTLIQDSGTTQGSATQDTPYTVCCKDAPF